jgi:5-methyltetrahydropteroyltriglutamate--homocysteine methyltransferase
MAAWSIRWAQPVSTNGAGDVWDDRYSNGTLETRVRVLDSASVPGGESKPPFRGDHVGSLLRPQGLKAAREAALGADAADTNLGPHGNPELGAAEDRCIREVVAMQERCGLRSATDGELRRRSWWLELLMSWDGIAAHRTGNSELKWRSADGSEQPFSRIWVTGPIRRRDPAVVRAFEFLAAATRVTAKVTLPAPSSVHLYAAGDKGILDGHYDDVDEFWEDLTAAYRGEIAALVEAGARYIQLDDTALAMLCDARIRETVKGWGHEPDALMREYARRINDVLAGLPEEVAATLHECRGNREGHHAAEGGYDPVADVLFNEVQVDGYFLDYDSSRAGTFEPLRSLPKGDKVVVLGLVSSKTPELEDADELRRQIDRASRFAPIEQLAIGPQCGFASSVKGNPLSEQQQWDKLARVVETATDVWGGL